MLPFVVVGAASWASLAVAAPVVFQGHKAIRRIQVFGDSFSDNGTGAFTISNGTWPADPNYAGHRFSNGPVYAERLAESLGVPLADAAIGGATTSNKLVQGYTGPGSSIPVPSITDQVASYAAHRKSREEAASTLYILLGGGNDAFFGLPNVTAQDSAANIKRAVKKLKLRGGRYFLLASMPPLGRPGYPYAVAEPEYAEFLGDFSLELRQSLKAIAGKDKNIAFVDLYTLFSSWYADPARYGFDPASLGDNCLKGAYGAPGTPVTVCDEPDSYMFWDEYHPTTAAHALVAKEAQRVLCKEDLICV